ncbi:MAG: tryptophan--tRNA ligase [Planctomycetota bacterium]
MSARPISLTGIKPTGTPHIGNLLGAIRPALELTKSYQGTYFIADYHALTTERNGDEMRENIYRVAATWMALGLDTEANLFFKQSDIPEVCELAWILSCFTGMGLLSRAHAFKDAQAKGRETNHGLFAYPVLMAADILLYETNVVPVGKDQKQHVEMCREMAQSINHTYGEDTLIVPEPLVQENVAVIPGLDGRKMSKSYNNTIEIFLPPKKMQKMFNKIVTGSETLEEPKDPTTCNVFRLFSLFASESETAELAAKYRAGDFGYGAAKKALFEQYEAAMAPCRERYEALLNDRGEIDRTLRSGAEKAREVAERVMDRLRTRCGFKLG